MNDAVKDIQAALEECFAAQTYATLLWHEAEPGEPEGTSECSLENLSNLVLAQHCYNFMLWHVEDSARRRDVPDSVIADCKRRVDALNQKRNDWMERVDACLSRLLTPHLPKDAAPRRNTETVGMAVDRLSILALKIYHMEEQTMRKDVGPDHIAACAEKLRVLHTQREALAGAVLELIEDYALGKKTIALYSQFKMYNDPSLNPEMYRHTPGSAPARS